MSGGCQEFTLGTCHIPYIDPLGYSFFFLGGHVSERFWLKIRVLNFDFWYEVLACEVQLLQLDLESRTSFGSCDRDSHRNHLSLCCGHEEVSSVLFGDYLDNGGS